MWERIIFNLLAFSLFLIIFVKMIKRNVNKIILANQNKEMIQIISIY